MEVERLRLAGFKSFVDPTELAIEPGLTGIVGPNGCGKSNLVEALRWVMGEGSAKRLRGGEMDDVIFAGSGGRPARNLAEVALTINNASRDTPFVHNDSPVLEVSRRLNRGSGSSYRVNGREVRARDVQLLFADAATGPHSAAIVGQGRIGALIGAKPGERRMLLDEAAGTAGLHARRHEAELKLRAAEDNLARLDDVVITLTAQIDALKKQARQAQRYRRLGEQIRRVEAHLMHARWRGAAAEAATLAADSRAAERQLATATEAALARDRERAEADAAVPPLRLAQAATAAAVQRIAHARQMLEQERERVAAARGEAERRLAQVAGDLGREASHIAEADAATLRLTEEATALRQYAADEATARTEAEGVVRAASADLTRAETGLQQMTEASAAGDAKRVAADRLRRDLGERLALLRARLAEARRQHDALQGDLVSAEDVTAATAAVADASAALDTARVAATAAAETSQAAQQRDAAAADAAREAERVLARLRAEAEALTRVLAPAAKTGATGPSLVSQLQVTPGFEAATAALLDGEMGASLIDRVPDDTRGKGGGGWRDLPPLEAVVLPDGVLPLAASVAAPAALARRLAHTGWVEAPEDGWRLQPRLAAGQSLVDRDGRLWRWDGFVRLSPGSAAAAEQLRQRNRLATLSGEVAAAAEAAGAAGDAAGSARAARDAAANAERAAVAALRAGEELLSRARAGEADLIRRSAAAEARIGAANETILALTGEAVELEARTGEAERAFVSLPDPSLTRSALEAARAQTAASRRRDGEARATLDRLAREAAARQQRLSSIDLEQAAWRKRRHGAAEQHQVLAERREGLSGEIAALAERPAAIASEAAALDEAAATAAVELRRSEDALVVSETRLRQATDAARQADAAVAEAREHRARVEARREAADETLERLREEIRDRLDVAPEQLGAALAASDEETPPDADAEELSGRLDRLLRERDGMGPVNLLAEQESSEVTERLAGLQHERTDLVAAIARLRRGIATLNQEGRRRLLAAFDQLNGHFGELFSRLFGGGRAELAWAEGMDDPLESGLDILASPPGKRLQTLSLLSGGEQALTALALIFSVFQTNPAPVCVLDEVDAPLDDSNVDGFCRLVADIADTTGTRFLLITHHRVTMARMDRLFGVTMAERGVSQLVSVDLARAAELRQTA